MGDIIYMPKYFNQSSDLINEIAFVIQIPEVKHIFENEIDSVKKYFSAELSQLEQNQTEDEVDKLFGLVKYNPVLRATFLQTFSRYIYYLQNTGAGIS
jgi:hypothetical protein